LIHQERHHGKQTERDYVSSSGHRISAGKVFADCEILKPDREREFRADQKSKCNEADRNSLSRCGLGDETPDGPSGSYEADQYHDWRFDQLRCSGAYAWHDQRDANGAEHEACSENESEV